MFKSDFKLHSPANENVVAPDLGPTVSDVLAEYLSCAKFRGHAASSQKAYTRVLTNWVCDEAISERPIGDIKRRELEAMFAKRTDGAANFLFKRVRVLLRFAGKCGYRDDDPTINIKCPPINRAHHTWTDDEIAQYRERWRLGTRERLALELALYTGQRLGDLSRMRWDHIRNGRLGVTQQKTGTALSIPTHPDLQAAMDAWKGSRNGAILVRTTRPAGTALTPESLGNLFARWIDAAGLPKRCVTHGLRKACARRLAEAGCSTKEIQSITGHETLSEVERYTKAASKARLADAAIARLTPGSPALLQKGSTLAL